MHVKSNRLGRGIVTSLLLAGCAAWPVSKAVTSGPPQRAVGSADADLVFDAPAPDAGGFRVRVAWPEERTVQALPETTREIRLSVTASDMVQPVKATVTRNPATASESVRLTVPPGSNRTLTVVAVNARGETVANRTLTGLAVTRGVYSPVTAALVTVVGAIGGTVVDPETGISVAGATVSVGTNQVATDANGRFTLVDVPQGTASVSFDHPGYYASSTVASVEPAASTALGSLVFSARRHWTPVNLGRSATLYKVLTRSKTEAWVGGANGLLMVTKDAGKTWKQVSGIPATVDVRDIAFDGDLVGYVACTDGRGNGGAYRTSDGGFNWTRLGLAPVGAFQDYASCSVVSSGVVAFVLALQISSGDFSGSLIGSVEIGDYRRSISVPRSAHVFGFDSYGDPFLIKDFNGYMWRVDVSDGLLWLVDAANGSLNQYSDFNSPRYFSGLPFLEQLSFKIGQTSIAWNIFFGDFISLSGDYYAFCGKSIRNSVTGNVYQGEIKGSVVNYVTPRASYSRFFQSIDRRGRGLVAVGTKGLISMTPRYDQPWSDVPVNAPDPLAFDLTDVSFADADSGFAITENGSVLRY
jgi:hypothetical protein